MLAWPRRFFRNYELLVRSLGVETEDVTLRFFIRRGGDTFAHSLGSGGSCSDTGVIGAAHRAGGFETAVDSAVGALDAGHMRLRQFIDHLEAAVLGHCGSQLARYKVPKEVRFLDELPHNATGKVLKHQLPKT